MIIYIIQVLIIVWNYESVLIIKIVFLYVIDFSHNKYNYKFHIPTCFKNLSVNKKHIIRISCNSLECFSSIRNIWSGIKNFIDNRCL